MFTTTALLSILILPLSARGQFDWNSSTSNTNLSALATLWKFEKCSNQMQIPMINKAFEDAAVLASAVAKDINWNSAGALEFFGPPGNNKVFQKRIQDNFARAAVYQPGWLDWFKNSYVEIHCDDPLHLCPCNFGQTLAYTRNDWGKYGYPMVNFCPQLFALRPLQAAVDYAQARDRSNLTLFQNPGMVFLHEMMHIKYVGQPRVYDDYVWRPNEKPPAVEAIGPLYTKYLARTRNGAGTSTNADNYAQFAMAMHVQNLFHNYPHIAVLPVKRPDETVADWTSALLTGEDSDSGDLCLQATASAPTATVVPTTYLSDSLYPTSYISQWNAWQTDVPSKVAPPITISTPTATPPCVLGSRTYSLPAIVSAPPNAQSIKIFVPAADRAAGALWNITFGPGLFGPSPSDNVAAWEVSTTASGPLIGSGSSGSNVQWTAPLDASGTYVELLFKSGLGKQSYGITAFGTERSAVHPVFNISGSDIGRTIVCGISTIGSTIELVLHWH
ncbi:hypothetical protein C8R44DRAFT_990745 [Mycena epipterygia]|nr:hypothetical protein C8R44DRAFT_990745 [Mycena epipterygia]